jgi:2-polyprenyl-3-methyl-5-hydroxy-6-metoxy-1,4-benzoquinol methylase
MPMTQSELKRYTESNRAAWNEVMPLHQQAASETLDRFFSRPGAVRLDELEIGWLQKAGIHGKNVAHLCCNNGSELLSLKNLGAGECVGFDICDQAIQEACQRAALSGIECQFIRSDVYEIDRKYSNHFDMIYISAGCLGWLPDLDLFFEKASALLKDDGLIFMHEIHPFCEMLPMDNDPQPDPLHIVEPYFKTEPYIEHGGLDYVGNAEYTSTTTKYWFVHTLSDILMSLVKNHLLLVHFSEYEQDISSGHARVEAAKAGIPLSYILMGRKA